ncbi:MAG: Endothelin-converting enzyme 1, partial [Lacrimispora sp.]|nr:Endothelin-converting enzyme 1 [Lacrimispora sp.]
MKKVFFRILVMMTALTLLLTGCKSKLNPKPEEEQTEARPASGTGKASGGEANHVRMEDDYYDSVNGQMLSEIKIPGDAGGWSQFYKLDREAYETLNEVLRESVHNKKNAAEGSLEQKIADLYLTGMDMEGRRAAGFGGLAVYMDRISRASTIEEYLEQAGKIYDDLGVGSMILPQWSEDMSNSTNYALYFDGA